MARGALIVLCTLMMALWSSQVRAANLVTNGDFETGAPGASPPAPWTSNDGVFIDDVFPNGGTQDAAMGDDPTVGGPGTLSQLLATVAGQDYVLDFWVFDDQGSPADSFTASLGAFTLTLIAGDTVPSYTEFTTTVSSAFVGANATLSFTASNENGDWHLDDVSVEPVGVPEPSSVGLLGGAVIAMLYLLGMRRRPPEVSGATA